MGSRMPSDALPVLDQDERQHHLYDRTDYQVININCFADPAEFGWKLRTCAGYSRR